MPFCYDKSIKYVMFHNLRQLTKINIFITNTSKMLFTLSINYSECTGNNRINNRLFEKQSKNFIIRKLGYKIHLYISTVYQGFRYL